MNNADTPYNRNAGFIGSREQARLKAATVAIAGVGGVGGRIATQLVRLGVGHLRIADPDTFSITNLNRQEGSYQSTIGLPKAEVIAKLCKDINPDVSVEVYKDGVNETYLEAFVEGADIIVEATDFSKPGIGVMLARSARSHDIPMIMGVEIGFGATMVWFKPKGYTYERYLGLPARVSVKQLIDGDYSVDFRRWIPHVPSYGDVAALKAVASGKIEAPAIAPAVDICAGIVCTQIIALMRGRGELSAAPTVFHVDAQEHRSRVIHWPTLHHYRSLATMLLNNFLKKNNPTDFK